MVPANLNALTTSFAEIRNKDGEESPVAGALLLHSLENSCHITVGKWQLFNDAAELLLGLIGNSFKLGNFGTDNLAERFLFLIFDCLTMTALERSSIWGIALIKATRSSGELT